MHLCWDLEGVYHKKNGRILFRLPYLPFYCSHNFFLLLDVGVKWAVFGGTYGLPMHYSEQLNSVAFYTHTSKSTDSNSLMHTFGVHADSTSG